MTEENRIKKCALDECYEYNLLLTKCDRCEKNFCDKHFRNHGCFTVENIVYECDKCHKIITEDMLDHDYKSRNIHNIKILNKNIKRITDEIDREVQRELEKQLQNRSSDNKSYIFNKNTTATEISDRVEGKYRDHLIGMRQLKNKLILREHQALGCYIKPKSTKKNKCIICKKKDFLIECSKCGKNFCLFHRLPEVHKCKG